MFVLLGYTKKTTEVFAAPEEFQKAVGRSLVEFEEMDWEEVSTGQPHRNARRVIDKMKLKYNENVFFP